MTGRSGLSNNLFFSLLFVVALGVGYGYLLHHQAKTIINLHHIELSKCTILDAQAIAYRGRPHWAIHVNFTVPPAHDQQGTNPNDHYFVNQTFPCYASTRDLEYVAFTPQKPDGLTVFSVIVLSIMFSMHLIVIFKLCLIYTRVHTTTYSAPITDRYSTHRLLG